MHLPLLGDIVILLGISVVVVFALQRLKIPSILGLLLTGVMIGPYALSLVSAVHEVEIIAEIGVILLLFVIGMELSIKQLIAMKRTVFVGGLIQVGLTVCIAGASYYFMGNAWNEALFVGFLFSLSSTAIVLGLLQSRNEIATPQGKNALGILIFQDIIVVPMMLITPIIAGQTDDAFMAVGSLLLKTALVLGITFLSARYIVPKFMHEVAKTNSKELFLLTTISICFAVAFLTSEAGLSLALGAFLAGLVISESDYSHQATSIILPFKELFTSIFFISVGMLLDLRFFIEHIGVILILLVVVFVVKALVASIAVAVLKYPPRTVLLTGLSLFQVGEFAFILSKVGIEFGLLTDVTNQYFLSVSIISMLLTPFVIQYAEPIVTTVLTKFSKKEKAASIEKNDEPKVEGKLKNHLVIIGYGINGSNLAKAAQFSNIPYVVVEMNAETVARERKKGVPIHYGDATQFHILDSLNLFEAKAVVIAISDAQATKRMIANIRDICKSVYVLVRTRFVSEINELLALGANDVIPEEFETSIELFSRVLQNFFVPLSDIDTFIDTVRADNYDLFKSKNSLPRTARSLSLPDFKFSSIRVNHDYDHVVGSTLIEANLRAKYGVTVMAIQRENEMIYDMNAKVKILLDDIIYIHGETEKMEQFHQLLG
jgi:CPA2 family monovalent cation:H+ antiporter-2